jgi:fatty-acyl-CoA synthase
MLASVEPTIAAAALARQADEAPGIVFGENCWSWAEVIDQAAARAALLEDLRRRGPFHIGVLLDNVPEYAFTLIGAALAGATVVGLNPTRRGGELERDINHTDCQLVLTEAAHAPLLEGLDLRAARVLDVEGETWAGLLEEHKSAPPPPRLAEPEELYLLIFTAGSTGAPKAVRMTQGRAARTASEAARAFTKDDVLYCAMPLFHGNALLTNFFPALISGASVVLRRRFSASSFLQDILRFGCTYFNYVGPALSYILATASRPDDGDNPLRWALGSEAAPRDIAEFQRRFGCLVVEGYGSSENAVVIRPAPGMPAGSLGKPQPGADVAILDPATGEECPPGQVGEIVGRNTAGRFEGYYKNPEAEAARLRNGWYWTGDLAWRDAEGWFYFAGRSTDWLRVDGENLSACLIEQLLRRYPPARAVAVYGIADPLGEGGAAGDRVMAALELADPLCFDPEDFSRFLSNQADLGTKWPPSFVRLCRRLPLTGVGKLDKVTLRAQGCDTDDPLWWRRGRELTYEPFSARALERR